MHVAYFTERPYRPLTEDKVIDNGGAFFAISNKHYDPIAGSKLYDSYFDEYVAAEQLGFDGIAVNEHHGNPSCMGNVVDIEAAILARITERVKILIIGNALPTVKHPLRLAEELAAIDVISKGRLVAGWVRGAGSEQFANNTNPALNRAMFEEAHDFIIRAWTEPGPWRYEGEHFHYRHVNPWVTPYQKPHPPTLIPGVLSLETVEWAAARKYPYLGLGTALGPTAELWNAYAKAAAQHGYQAGPENFGYLVPTLVADTEEKAIELGRGFAFGGGQRGFARPEHSLPPGYNSAAAIKRLANIPKGSWLGVSNEKLEESRMAVERASDREAELRKRWADDYNTSRAGHQMLIGTPDQVLEKAKTISRVLRPGSMTFLAVQGPVPEADRMRSLELLATEVVPPLREHAAALGLHSPFEVTPGARSLATDVAYEPVIDQSALAALD